MPEGNLLVGAVLVVVGVFFAHSAHTTYGRYRTLFALSTEAVETTGTKVAGAVEVSEPATPQHAPHGSGNSELPGIADSDLTESAASDLAAAVDGDSPALWAWRVRRKRKKSGSSSGSNTTWETVDGGVAAGEFVIREEWDRIGVDASSVTTPETETESVDPFDVDHLFLGDPDIDVSMGEPTLPQRLVDEYVPFDLEVTMSVGRQTAAPNRYQATVIREGEELLVRGELDESGEQSTLCGSEETPLVVVDGDPEQKASSHRRKALGQGVLSAVIVLAGVGVGLAGFL